MPPKPRKPAGTVDSEPRAKSTQSPEAQRKPAIKAESPPVKRQPSKPSRASKRIKPRQNLGTGRDDSFEALLEPFYCGKGMCDEIDTARDKWNLLPAFLKVKGLVKQHIDSFDHFVDVELKKIVHVNRWIRSDSEAKFWFQYTDIRVGKPNRQDEDGILNAESDVTPNECRLRDMTYAAPIYVDYKYWRYGKVVSRRNIQIGRLPIMLRSSKCVLKGRNDRDMSILQECPIDPGGYFIIRGQEKVILVQEQLSKNRVLVESQKGIVQASVTSSTHDRKSKSYVLLKKDRIYVRHNVLSDDIPIVVMLKAMGIQSDNEILLLTAGVDNVYQDEFAVNFEESAQLKVHTQHQALDYIGSRLKIKRPYGTGFKQRNPQQEAMEALASIIIAHIPVHRLDFRDKALYVCFMVRRVLMVMHDPKIADDRDYVGNKRLELAGQLMALLFEDHFKRFNAEFKTTIDRVLNKRNRTDAFDAHEHFKVHSSQISAGMERAIATGNWNLKRFRMDRAGVTHVLSRLSYISALGMMTRISSQFEKTRKISGPRSLQSSQFGMLCPSDTPEGEACGLVKNLALMTHITTEDDDEAVKDLVFLLGAEEASSSSGMELYKEGAYLILLNGTPLALTRQPKIFLRAFRKCRRLGRVSEFVSAHINDHHFAIHIATDEGRICRPLIVVERSRAKVTKRALTAMQRGTMTFDDFLRQGLVEYLDVNEENDSNIAVYEHEITTSTTHLEIEPFTILGAVAGLIPYPHHNQSPRNTYQCAMGKQAIGSIGYNQNTRLDTLLFLMVYPQKPLVKTRTIELVKYDKLPAGQNAIVAVMSYSGYDIEDAIVLNKASCDRGFGRCQVYRKNATHFKRYANGKADVLGARTPGNGSHRNIGSDGIIDVGAHLAAGDTYLVKQTPKYTNVSDLPPLSASDSLESRRRRALLQDEYRASEMQYRLPDPCVISKVLLASTESDARLLKVHTRQTRAPEVGDKFSSRHGQKGVVGLIAEAADLPFTDDGTTPDLIMNPHGFPSRMTVGKMLELVAGKSGVLAGAEEYGTAFGGSRVEDMGRRLVDRGFSYSGKDFMTCGVTGAPLPAYVFFGPIYYQKLKHMVQDKMHSRATGPRQIMSRQPTEGRSRGGGLRLGEMERDCLIAYGASQLLLERLMLSSDKHECDVCERCGMMGYHGWCQTCESGSDVVSMTIPYATKLLVQELLSMNIKAVLRLEDEVRDE